jgi:hypothetical protein
MEIFLGLADPQFAFLCLKPVGVIKFSSGDCYAPHIMLVIQSFLNVVTIVRKILRLSLSNANLSPFTRVIHFVVSVTNIIERIFFSTILFIKI